MVPYGEPARRALETVIREAKAADPLAPVTVVVPNNYVGLALRRRLASETPLVNVRFQVLARVAELLGGAELAAVGRKPLVPWLQNEAVRTALRESPGVFATVADHPSTARRLAAAAVELRDLTDDDLDRVASQGRRPADVVRVVRRARELTEKYYDAADLLDAAARALRAGTSVADEAGLLVFYLPRNMTASAASLFAAAAERGRAAAIIGWTGDERADSRAQDLCRMLGGDSTESPSLSVPTAATVASLPDAEEEVRDAIRQACEFAQSSGIPFYRMAILYGQADQYGQLVHEVLTVAGIPHNSPPIRKLSQSLAGRMLQGIYRMSAAGYRRDVVADWLTSAPIEQNGRSIPSHRWDEISREAGVVRGADQWQRRLAGWAAEQDAFAADRLDGGDHYRRQAGFARDLATFMEALIADIGPARSATGSEHAEQALTWLDDYLPEAAVTFPDDDHATDQETGARDEVKALLESIINMAGELPAAFAGHFSRDEFATLLDESLDSPTGHAGKLGEGIFVGPVSTAAEMEFDATFIVGLVEGSYPSGAAEDPLLTEAERAASGAMASRTERTIDQRRAFLAALAGGGRVQLSMPRSALRDQKVTLPSRWLLESASALRGQPVYASELDDLMRNRARPAWFRVEFSLESALAEEPPASLQERDLASLLHWRARPDSHFLARDIPALGNGIRARRSRLRRKKTLGDSVRRLDEWNGLVGAGMVPLPSPEKPISPTALETFAACPFRYFLGHVLRVGEFEKPEEADTIAAKDVGTIIHDALEQFFLETKERTDPAAPWTPAERARLTEIGRLKCEEAEHKGLTGRELAWVAQRARIMRDLDRFLDYEYEFRNTTGFRFDMAEVAFGTRPTSPTGVALDAVQYRVDEDTVVAFRGRIDRVDRRPDGAILVTDYKTGSSYSYKSIASDEPFGKLEKGKHLQLPVYALALKDMAGGAPVSAQYWFVSEKESFGRTELLLDKPTEDAFRETMRRFVDTIRAGYFPPVPGEEDRDSWKNCRYCPYDSICPTSHRLELWDQWKHDENLVEFVELVDGSLAKGGANASDAS